MKTRRQFLQSAAVLASAPGEAPDPTLRIWDDRPAPDWNSAYPIGNGRMGAMIFGGAAEELLQLNEDTLTSGGPGADNLPLDVTKDFDEVMRLLRARQFAEAGELMTQKWTGRSWPAYQPLSDVRLTMSHGGEARQYQREILLDRGLSRVAYEADGVRYEREFFASYPARVIVVRLKSSEKGKLGFTLRQSSAHPTAKVSDGGARLRGQAPGFVNRRSFEWIEQRKEQWKYPEIYNADGSRKPNAKMVLYGSEVGGLGTWFETHVRIVECDGRQRADGEALVVEGATSAVVLIAAGTSFRGGDPAAIAKRDLDAAARQSYDALLRAHTDDVTKLMSRMTISLGGRTSQSDAPTPERIRKFANGQDPELAALYFQYARYLMIAGSRPGTQPLNLQGIWNNLVIPPWSSGYTINVNTEMNYWPVEAINLSECVEPLVRMVEELAESGRETARKMYGRRGWVAHHNTTLWRGTQPVDNNAMPSFWPMGGAWLCQPLWEHYRYTGDEKYLRRVWPLLRDAAAFVSDWLVADEKGRLVTAVSNSPENLFYYTDGAGKRRDAGVSSGPTMDLAICRDLFGHCIEAARVLRADAAFARELEDKLKRLLPYQIGRRGQLQEWPEDFDEREPQHRHVSHLYALHPGTELHPDKTPELCAAVKRTLELRGDGGTGWSRAWKINFWARLLDGDHAYLLLKNLFVPSTARIGGVQPNLLCAHPPFQIDGNFGGAAGIAEMLVQSHRDEIHLLPALPAAWPKGRVKGLRVRGGFELTFAWAEGRLTECEVRSVTGSVCRLRYRERKAEIKTRPGAVLRPKELLA